MELEEVRKLVKLVEDSGIEELEITQKGSTIRIQKSRLPDNPTVPVMPAPVPVPPAVPGAATSPAPAGEPAPAVEPERGKWKEIRAPIVGTFYRAPSPEADPYVQVGDRITSGQTLCIIEAMKVMNEIEAEFPGVIKEILVENAMPVEAEAAIFLVDPA
jgi:acetyl-CoA carboxylase biotin carboxyl carrier protein